MLYIDVHVRVTGLCGLSGEQGRLFFSPQSLKKKKKKGVIMEAVLCTYVLLYSVRIL